ncbi:hypothetical protein [Sphingomonas sp. 37zxx]|uniref:hypothetical protein n=1 Tax=Sphingomonas sp. 37zxx TaxID=1550073 RepID=UPI0018CCA6E2|nr:hypothetical protein [Sphingomonas sp. 37zxx]
MNDPQTNKPDGETTNDKPTPVDDRGAVENQSSVTPDDYPDDDGGKPDYGGN